MIPRTAHFVWFGRELPWVHLVAVQSAALHGGFERVLFHHADVLDAGRALPALGATPRVELRRLDPVSAVEAAADARLVDCYRALETPAAKSNVLRVALLKTHGGVYLDTDTVTVRTLAPLCAAGGAFCGEERLVFPAGQAAWHARLRPSALLRMAARDVLRRVPDGYRAFRRLERLYPAAVNNAVLGAEAGHPLLVDLLARMRDLPRERRHVRYALGTHLLQAAVSEWRGGGLTVLPPEVFFPLAPEISEHWFRLRPKVALSDVLLGETLVVHWYASVRTRRHRGSVDEAWVRGHADRQLFSALALPTVTALANAT